MFTDILRSLFFTGSNLESAIDLETYVRSVAGAGALGALMPIVIQAIKSRSSFNEKKLDDRGKFTEEIQIQVTNLWHKVNDQDRLISGLRMRDVIFIKCFSSLGGEMRLLNGYLALHQAEINSEHFGASSQEILSRNVTQMKLTLEKMNVLIETSENTIEQLSMEYIREVTKDGNKNSPDAK